MSASSKTILGRIPSHPRSPSGSARRPQLDGTFPDASTAEASPDEVVGASLSSETTAVWERLSNECACDCDWGCASCEPEETTEWRRA